ncbi:cysteine/serine-rich nuclear protein [Mytilus galloprovincialis]|uniref:Cysteine/serine-rich nuclear protein n=1 Tax=Mytilus galloprovincialis TaxID=29158 RepID=A0A8B6GJX9_MYTGA|nr:cysteine/serine-rich nuclear protein [Mytilus galloprovincialis]
MYFPLYLLSSNLLLNLNSYLDDLKISKDEKNVRFKDVTVYYFPREQGFTSVPHEGGSTLGMSYGHTDSDTYSLADHAKIRKRSYHAALGDSAMEDEQFETDEINKLEDEDWYYSTKRLKSEHRLTPAQRRLLLRQSSLVNVDRSEADDCKDIRDSRRKSGCNCKHMCDPNTCACSLAGIECFVEDDSFPCRCSKPICKNPHGHYEYNPDKVQEHFTRTMEKLKN